MLPRNHALISLPLIFLPLPLIPPAALALHLLMDKFVGYQPPDKASPATYNTVALNFVAASFLLIAAYSNLQAVALTAICSTIPDFLVKVHPKLNLHLLFKFKNRIPLTKRTQDFADCLSVLVMLVTLLLSF